MLLTSGKVSEALGIIEFNPKAALHTKIENTTKSKIALLYPNLFSDIGTLKKYQVKFHINRDVQPIAASARPVPFHLRQKFEKEIESMEKQGIIEEHHGPAPWISNVVLAPKEDGGTRVTIDRRQANKAIEPTNIPIPRVEDIKAQLAGGKHFSKLDFKSAFHQLEIDETS